MAHWEFDEGAGASVGDSSVNTNSGILSDTSIWTTDAAVGYPALDFKGGAVNGNAIAAVSDGTGFDFGGGGIGRAAGRERG